MENKNVNAKTKHATYCMRHLVYTFIIWQQVLSGN
jgi:hypothetical protein